jgi:primosomal protein N' (replication factor Y)
LVILTASRGSETAVSVIEALGLRASIARKADLAGGPLFAIRRRNTEPCMIVGRPAGGSMPRVTVVDMSREEAPLSRTLVDAMRRVHAGGGQSILFLNHRGFSYFFHCRSCGYEMRCRNCSVSLTYHKGRGEMVCHYCGFRAAPLEVCPECRSLDVGYSGFGTEAIEEEIARRLPDLVVRRLDTDAARRRGEIGRALRAFRDGSTHVLLGTQMVAKGLDFPGVKLVGIVLADVGLQFPDFRAAERTFSLIVQVAGRAGRSSPDGQVVVQTYRPNHEAIRLAAAGEITAFYEGELELRRELGFPPFSRLVRIVCRGPREEAVANAAEELGKRLRAELRPPGEVLGPVECPLAVVAGKHRHHLIARFSQPRPLIAAVRRALAAGRVAAGVTVDVDADPVDLL